MEEKVPRLVWHLSHFRLVAPIKFPPPPLTPKCAGFFQITRGKGNVASDVLTVFTYLSIWHEMGITGVSLA